eukprot:6191251-Pleurochrysis_carterae.AAC.1
MVVFTALRAIAGAGGKHMCSIWIQCTWTECSSRSTMRKAMLTSELQPHTENSTRSPSSSERKLLRLLAMER